MLKAYSDLAKTIAWMIGTAVGIGVLVGDYDFPWWGRMALGIGGLWLAVNCIVRLFPRGIWPLEMPTRETHDDR